MPDFLTDPLTLIETPDPLDGQRSLLPDVPTILRCQKCNVILERDATECLACDPHSLFSQEQSMPATKTRPNTKKSPGKTMKPSKAFNASPDDAAKPDTNQMLRAALLIRDGARDRLAQLCDDAPNGDGVPTKTDILDHLGEEWEPVQYNKGDDTDAHPAGSKTFLPGSWYAQGGAMPSIWFGSSVPAGEPSLQGFALAAEALPIIIEIAKEQPPAPPLIVAAIEQPPNGRLPLDRIRVVTNPREDFDEAEMQELEASIRARGIIQALTVSPADADGIHTLIAGERRLRCARKLEHPDVPVYVRQFAVEDEAVDRLVENLQRADLKPLEVAKGFRDLLTGGISQRELARRLGLDQGYISNHVRLLKLPEMIQAAINSRQIGKTEGRTLASWTDHPAVINEFTELWNDKLQGGMYADTPFLKLLQHAVRDATRSVDKSHDGPRFKVTPEIRQELQIIHVKVGDWEADRAFYTPLWDELQGKADQERREKKAAAEAKKAAVTPTPSEPNPATPAVPSKPTLSAYTLGNMWKGWFMRALYNRFNVKKLKPADEGHLNRIAVLLLEPLPHLLDHFKLSTSDDEVATGALMQQTLEGLLEGLRSQLMLELAQQPFGLFNSAFEAQAMCDAVGISLKTWSPDKSFLTVIPDEILLDFASEYDMRPSKIHDKLVDQLGECWTVGWIPEPLNIFAAAD